jgi:hypothetical protein
LKKLQANDSSLWLPQRGDWPLFMSLLNSVLDIGTSALPLPPPLLLVRSLPTPHLLDNASSSSNGHPCDSSSTTSTSSLMQRSDSAPASSVTLRLPRSCSSGKMNRDNMIIHIKKGCLLLKFFVSVLLNDIRIREDRNLGVEDSLLRRLIATDLRYDNDIVINNSSSMDNDEEMKRQQQRRLHEHIANSMEQFTIRLLTNDCSDDITSTTPSRQGIPHDLSRDITIIIGLVKELMHSLVTR